MEHYSKETQEELKNNSNQWLVVYFGIAITVIFFATLILIGLNSLQLIK